MDIEEFNRAVDECGDHEKFKSDDRLRLACLAYFIHGANLYIERLRAAEAESESLRRQMNGAKQVVEYVRKERDRLTARIEAAEKQEPDITLHADKGDYSVEWHHPWSLSAGSQKFYIRPPIPSQQAVTDDEYGLPAGYADWYNKRFSGMPVDVSRDHNCEAAWRAALSVASYHDRCPSHESEQEGGQ